MRPGPPSRLATLLRLGRVSNLPTVSTNVLAGLALAGATFAPGLAITLAIAMSALYVAGMYLNDAFDREWDARHRPERPIPAGHIAATTVFAIGFGLMALGLGLVVALHVAGHLPSARPLLSSVVLAALIVYYDLHHKQNRLSPVVMGLCRVAVYVTAGFVATAPAAALWLGSALLLAHLIGLSYVAKHETRARLLRLWPVGFLVLPVLAAWWFAFTRGGVASFVLAALHTAAVLTAIRLVPGFSSAPRPAIAIPLFIANISLLDGVLIASTGRPALALACIGPWALTLLLQRKVPGT